MGRGVVGLVELAVTVAFAAPVALLGLLMLSDGRTLLGVTFLLVAAGMVAIEEYLLTPGDLPGVVVERTVGRLVGGDDGKE